MSMGLLLRDISYKWNYVKHGLLWLTSFTSMFSSFISVLHFFLWWSNVLLYEYTRFCLAIHQFMDIWVISTFFCLFVFMSNTAMNTHAQNFVWMYVFNSLGYIWKSSFHFFYLYFNYPTVDVLFIVSYINLLWKSMRSNMLSFIHPFESTNNLLWTYSMPRTIALHVHHLIDLSQPPS